MKYYGYVGEPFDPRDVWLDEILAGETVVPPQEYRIEGLVYEPQGAWPFCVSFSTTTLLEWKLKNKDGIIKSYSQPHLFFHSGGGKRGSFFRSNLDTAKAQGNISYSLDTIPVDIWVYPSDTRFETRRQESLKIPFTNPDKNFGYIRVNNDVNALKQAIMNYGPVLVGVAAKGDYWNDNHKRSSDTDTHAVLLVGWDSGHWILFDSLTPRANFYGYHKVDISYPFYSAFVITDLPSNWKEIRDTKRQEFENALNHYGKPRNFALEVEVANRMLQEFKNFKNQSVLEAAGKFWTVYINAVAYGGYNITYTKFGIKRSGDVISDCYFWRRTGQHVFDFNKPRYA